jgi:4'-phosphopantetheinyl transferase
VLTPTVQQESPKPEQPLMAVLEQVWNFAPTHLGVPSNMIHVWRASLDPPARDVERLMRVLSDAEHIRARQFYFERDRKRFIAGRGLLRIILGRYLAISPDRLQLDYGVAGKPALSASQARQGIEFSLSHSRGLILYAVTCNGRIGIDVEHVRTIPNTDHIAERVLSPREYAVFRALPREQRQTAFFCGWTRKEAYLKACGDGLSRELNRVDVSLAPFEPARRLGIQGGPQASSRWSLQELAPAPGYVAAVASEGENAPPLSCLQWPEWL